jgi:hypothetical protein
MSTPTVPDAKEGIDKLTVSNAVEGVDEPTVSNAVEGVIEPAVSNAVEGVDEPTVSNTIEDVDELSIKICDIITASSMADKVLKLGEQASKITSIYIDSTSYMKAWNGPRSTFPDATEVSTLCAPVISILKFIKSQNGGVKSFTWLAERYYYGREFTRPTAFWTAIFDHALTLETIHIGFFCHEAHDLASQPPKVCFPALTHLYLDASNEDGSDGRFIDAVLNNCPKVEDLCFLWSQCNADVCQIQNVTWTWTFPNLKKLYADGWNFAPNAYQDFLKRHPDIESLKELVTGPAYYDSD